jgi:hypothetical protein
VIFLFSGNNFGIWRIFYSFAEIFETMEMHKDFLYIRHKPQNLLQVLKLKRQKEVIFTVQTEENILIL